MQRRRGSQSASMDVRAAKAVRGARACVLRGDTTSNALRVSYTIAVVNLRGAAARPPRHSGKAAVVPISMAIITISWRPEPSLHVAKQASSTTCEGSACNGNRGG